MTRRERLSATFARQPTDRPPYAVWRHFPTVDGSPAGLAQATLRFHERYGSDFLVLVPPEGWAVAAWGCEEAEEAGHDGRRPCARHAVREAEDWRRIRAVDPAGAPGYQEQLETIVRLGFDRRLGDAPVLLALSAPLTLAGRLAGPRLPVDCWERPAVVADALAALTDTTLRWVEAVLAEGIAGVFYVITGASRTLLPEEAYAELGEPADRRVLEAIGARSALVVIHARGDRLAFDRLARLPAQAWSWDARTTAPSLADGLARVPGAVVGGLDARGALRDGSAAAAVAEAQEAIAETGGTGLVVAPGDVLWPNTPDDTVAAVIRALGGRPTPILGVTR
ncbi:MAG TPA: uroporphyrinogen decarboxylase family protein [Methylomirabilota bacterium]|nr:uroporphyrinogen decarboxylase family protein [Methylomirabilota bacterium]